MTTGVLIAESLRVGAILHSVPLRLHRVERVDAGELSPAQREAGVPGAWTLLSFEVPDSRADELAEALAGALDEPGWYADLRSDTTTWVAFPGRVFRYPRGDENGRAAAREHGRAVGVPEGQLDWPV
jgi:hypothetical protein